MTVASLMEIAGILIQVRISICFDLHEPASGQVVKTHDAVDFYAMVYGGMSDGKTGCLAAGGPVLFDQPSD